MNVLRLIATIAPYVALLSAVGMATVGAYAARTERVYCAVFGIGGAITTACMAIPMLFESILEDMLIDSIVLLVGAFVLCMVYLAIIEAAAWLRTMNPRRETNSGAIDWDVFIPAPNEVALVTHV